MHAFKVYLNKLQFKCTIALQINLVYIVLHYLFKQDIQNRCLSQDAIIQLVTAQ